ncbi:hypothetical protein GC176_08860 [bacterium]|nr:hypothetical protein [bacterium]
MCRLPRRHFNGFFPLFAAIVLLPSGRAFAAPVLNSVFPAGGQAGTTVEVTIAGSGLGNASSLLCSQSGIVCRKVADKPGVFALSIPEDTFVGQYDLAASTPDGLSSPRVFVVGNRRESLEAEPNNDADSPQQVPLDATINGRIQKGDVDRFAFSARQGQRVIIECFAERIDSNLRAMLELFDASGRRIAVSRGFFGVDPLIDFTVPADGEYVVRLYDLVFSGSDDHFYRLDLDTGPRAAFTIPSVIPAGETTRVTVFGWNLRPDRVTSAAEPFDEIAVDVTAPSLAEASPAGLRLGSQQIAVDALAWRLPGGHAPVLIGVTDVPVVVEAPSPSSRRSPQTLEIPCEVSGQLIESDERDWLAVTARRGEVLWLEGFGERIGSPVDLDITVLDESGKLELARFTDVVQDLGSTPFPTSHSDPSGRFVVPGNGRYLILVRSVTGGLTADPRRVYRLSLRREEAAARLVVLPHADGPQGITLNRQGRTLLDVVAFRQRGLTGSIRVTADDLPSGIDCPDVWLGPGVDRAPLVISATDDAQPLVGALSFSAHSRQTVATAVRGGVSVRTGRPTGWGRVTDSIPVAIAEEAPVRITANGHEPRHHHLFGDLQVRHSPGGILDVAVQVERQDLDHQAAVTLIGVGVPDQIPNQMAEIPAGQNKGYVSFYLPPTLPPGKYTLAVQGQTTVPVGPPNAQGERKTEAVVIFSNPVTFEVHPAAFVVSADPHNPRQIRRGEIIQVKYSARRINGFISKIHTELYTTSEAVDGLRGRGVTFVGQTDTGTIQIIANDNAPLGHQPALRLYAVGVVEDQAIYHGSCFLDLEVVESSVPGAADQ